MSVLGHLIAGVKICQSAASLGSFEGKGLGERMALMERFLELKWIFYEYRMNSIGLKITTPTQSRISF